MKKKNIAIIPARSGSKGLKDKNIKLLNGIPLLGYSVSAAQRTGLFDEIMVSTDSTIYAEIAQKSGAAVPFLRSSELGSDSAGSWEVVKEVLKRYAILGVQFDTVCLLQPTSPLRTTEDIIGAYALLNEKQANAVTSVCLVDHSPLWSMVLPEDQSLEEFRHSISSNRQRQQLDTYYRLNGAIYIRKLEYRNSDIVIMDDREYAYVMERSNSVDIDTIDDFRLAEVMIGGYGAEE